jgi:hypothetical protein
MRRHFIEYLMHDHIPYRSYSVEVYAVVLLSRTS